VLLGANLYFWHSREEAGATPRTLTVLVAGLSVLTLLPSEAYGTLFWLRYVFLGAAILVSLVHWLLWLPAPREAAPALRASARFFVVGAGVCSLFLVLLMGTIRETARGPYTVYGEQTQSQARQLFTPPKGFYP
jgi:hypothetical protein